MNMQQTGNVPFRLTLVSAGFVAVLGVALVAGCTGAANAETAMPKAHSDGMMAAISDTGITASVKTKVLGEELLKDSSISVTTTNGVVTLEGTATDSDAKMLAENLTKTVDGVKSVDNKLVTASKTENEANLKEAVANGKRVMSDSWITTKVKSSILADNVSKGFEVNVDARGGVVILKGSLASQDAITRVKTIAAGIEGVKSVDVSMLFVAGK